MGSAFKYAVGGCCCGIVINNCAEFETAYFTTLGAPDVLVRIVDVAGGPCDDQFGNPFDCSDVNTTWNLGPLAGSSPNCQFVANEVTGLCESQGGSAGVVSGQLDFETASTPARVIGVGLNSGAFFQWNNIYPSLAAMAADASRLLSGEELECVRIASLESSFPCTRPLGSVAYMRFDI